MEVSKKVFFQVYPDDYLFDQADKVEESLTELAAVLDRWNKMPPPIEPRIIYRPVVYRPVPTGKKRTPVLLFPFNLLAAGITLGLTRLDAASARLVKTVIARWMHRLKRRLHIR